MRKIISFLVAMALLLTTTPVYAISTADLKNLSNEELREAIRGDELWAENYPKGLFNFVGTQYIVHESQEFMEIAIARQGGTKGDVTVDFKAIDVSAKYGEDYVIRVYENSDKYVMKENKNSIPLMETLQDDANINISKPEETNGDITVQQSVYSEQESVVDEGEASEPFEEEVVDQDNTADEKEQPYVDLEAQIVDIGNKTAPKSLRQLKESALGIKSDRPDWKEVDLKTVEQLKSEYDQFFYNIPGAQSTIRFKDGEYIKYLYIIPLNDNLSESEEQILFALTNPEGGAVRGEFYMSYANIIDDEEYEASTFELSQDSVVAKDGQATVTVRRIGGLSQYASVNVGTEEHTAVAGVDYIPGLQELLFTPGMKEQEITVDILKNPKMDSYREFKIALDRENKNVNIKKAETKVIIIPETETIQSGNLQVFSADYSAQAVSNIKSGVEVISPYGFSPQKGQWAVVAQDFLSGSKAGTAYGDGNEIRLRANGSTSFARATNVKLYGVEKVNFAVGNSGCGRHWTERLWYTFWIKKVDKSEHNFNTTFGVVSPTNNSPELYKENGNLGRKGVDRNIAESLWNTSWLGYGTWAAGGNQSTADLGWLRLYLKEYSLQVKNDEANVPKFETKEYEIADQKLNKKSVIESSQPGSISIKTVYSNVNNDKSLAAKTASTGVYRSDKIEFSVTYADNIIGKNSKYVGFEVHKGNGKWERFSGTTLSLDKEFFSKSGMLDGIRAGTIQVRPVFEHNNVNLTLKADTINGYIKELGEEIAEKTFTGLKVGDKVNAIARNFSASLTPSWSSNNNSKLHSTDSTGANTSVIYELSSGSNNLNVNFFNPTIIVKANPNVYKHNVSKPEFRIDGVLYSDHESLSAKMSEIFEANSDENLSNDQNPTIAISFKYVFDNNYPDPYGIVRNEFGNPSEAVLTVYKSDSTVKGKYSSNKTQSSPNTYTVSASNGTYTYSGKLKDLGWEADDYATVIIYGSKKRSDGVLQSTRENVIDFLVNSGNYITVKTPKDEIVAGDVYQPVVIEKADPVNNYEMTSYLVPGFTAKWRDYSGDLDGDGQESYDETEKLRKKMAAYGMNLDTIRSNPNNRSYDALFWGNFFNYAPKFFNPSQILYNFEKSPEESSKWEASIVIYEKYRTVIDPDTPSNDLPVKGATVIVGNKAYETDENGVATMTDPIFEEGVNYSARVLYKGYEFYTYVQPGRTVKHVFDTSDIMRPTDFKARYKKNDNERIPLDKDRTLLPVRRGTTEVEFRVDNGKEGVAANDAIIRIYETNSQGFKTNVIYEERTGKPSGGIFTYSMDLLNEGIKPGNRMYIAPLYVRDEEIAREYPEVDVGLTFSMDLTLVSALASFDTPLAPAVEFIGKMNNKFDLSMDLDLKDILKTGTRVDENGNKYNTKYITFGFNKEFEKKFGDQKEDEEEKKEEKSMLDKIKGVFSGASQKAATQKLVKDNKDVTAKKKGSGGGTFNFEFSTSLTMTIEEGQIKRADGITVTDGYHYFSSMVLMAEGKADFGAKYTYVTPIGIPVFASIDITGNANVVFGIEANEDERYVEKYRFASNGKVSLNANDYTIFTKFYISPSITIGAGVGMDYLKAFVEGNATADFNFTAPIMGDKYKSSGDGGLVISAAVGIKILFIQKKWTIYKSKRIELFSYGYASQAIMSTLNDPYTNYLYKTVEPVEDSDIMSRDYLKNQSGWLGNSYSAGKLSALAVDMSDEVALLIGAYPYPQTKIVPFDDKLLMLFINDPGEEIRDSRNRAQLFYSIYNGSTWSIPRVVDNDNTWDEAPDAFIVEDKILVTWSDASREFTEDDDAKTTLQAMNISGRWFDTATTAFEDEFEITKQTQIDMYYSDVNPKISYDEQTQRLMVYYTKVDYDDYAYDYDNTPVNDTDALKETTDDGDDTTMYGDIVNGYNVVAYRYAQRQPDGTFVWNTEYSDSEGLDPEYGFTPEGFYGQRFLDLSILFDIKETEVIREPHDTTVDEEDVEVPEVPEGYVKGVIGTETVVERVYGHTDPMVVESDLISYNGLALHTYVMDADSSKTTTGDQELYMQIYNYELNEFHHPIRITNNNVQDSKPQFVRSKGITYLYWLSGGDIVYMDITNMVKYNLLKKDIEVEGETRSIYIVDKYHTGIDGYVQTAVKSKADYPIDHFQIETNGDSQYILYTDYVITYKNGLKAGDPGTENLENVNKEKQIFAVYHEPMMEIKEVLLTDSYEDNETYDFTFVEGKGIGTYPEKVTVTEYVYNDANEIVFNPGENLIDYSIVSDVNGFKGVVEAGDPVIFKEYAHTEGYAWSKPVQLTYEEGANYSDISFLVKDYNSIEAVYVKYNQYLNEDNSFVDDTENRIFAYCNFNIESTIDAEEIELPLQLVKSEDRLNFSTVIKNTGIKPITNISYEYYIQQKGEQLYTSEPQAILDDNDVNMILGGDTHVLYGEFDLPEDISDIVVGFKIIDEMDNVLAESEKAVWAGADLVITVLDSRLQSNDTASISLFARNEGNIGYDGKLDILYAKDATVLRSIDLNVDAGGSEAMDVEMDIDLSKFGESQTREDGSVYQKVELKLLAGDNSVYAEIVRTADKETVDKVKNVKTFSINSRDFSINSGTTKKLNTITELFEPIPEFVSDSLEVRWRTSDAEVASVLPDGTVVGLSNGEAVITAVLAPRNNTTATLSDGTFADVDTSYELPDSMILKREVKVKVVSAGDSSNGSSGSSGSAGSSGGNNAVDNSTTDNTTDNTNTAQKEVVVQFKPTLEGKTSTIKPALADFSAALQKLKEENKTTLRITSSDEDISEIKKLVLPGGIMNQLTTNTVKNLIFDTVSAKMTLEEKTLNSLINLLREHGENQEVTISISRKSVEEYQGIKELVGNRPVYDFSILIGDKKIKDMTKEPIPLTLELEDFKSGNDSSDTSRIAGIFIAEDGNYKVMPISVIKDKTLVIKTKHNSMYSAIYSNSEFDDVSGWSKDSINFLSAREVINGVGDKRFNPKGSITRAEFITIMSKVAEAEAAKVNKTSFTDIGTEDWYAPFVEWGYAFGITKGKGNGRFEPNEKITRQDIAVLIASMVEKLEYELPELKEEIIFADNYDVANYAADSVKKVQKAGIINGRPNAVFAPKDFATREEAAQIIASLINVIVEQQ